MGSMGCTFFNHKILAFIAGYLADSKHFKALLNSDLIAQIFYLLTVLVWCLGGFPVACDGSVS